MPEISSSKLNFNSNQYYKFYSTRVCEYSLPQRANLALLIREVTVPTKGIDSSSIDSLRIITSQLLLKQVRTFPDLSLQATEPYNKFANLPKKSSSMHILSGTNNS